MDINMLRLYTQLRLPCRTGRAAAVRLRGPRGRAARCRAVCPRPRHPRLPVLFMDTSHVKDIARETTCQTKHKPYPEVNVYEHIHLHALFMLYIALPFKLKGE